MSAEITPAVLDILRLHGWRTLHIRPARTEKGWRSPLSGDGVGWPDIFAVRGHTALAIECKGETGYLSPEQRVWRDALNVAGIGFMLLRPKDIQGLPDRLRELSREGKA